MIQSVAPLRVALAQALATARAVGAAGAVVASAPAMFCGLVRRWSSTETRGRGGPVALIGAPASILTVVLANPVLHPVA